IATARKRLQKEDLTVPLRVRQAPSSAPTPAPREQADLPFSAPAHVAPLLPAPEESPAPRPTPISPRPTTVITSRPPATAPRPAQAALLLAQQEALAALGLEVSDFGAGTVLLAGYPALLGKKPPREILQAVVEYLMNKERVPTREVLLNDLMALVACHAAIRA